MLVTFGRRRASRSPLLGQTDQPPRRCSPHIPTHSLSLCSVLDHPPPSLSLSPSLSPWLIRKICLPCHLQSPLPLLTPSGAVNANVSHTVSSLPSGASTILQAAEYQLMVAARSHPSLLSTDTTLLFHPLLIALPPILGRLSSILCGAVSALDRSIPKNKQHLEEK